MTCCSNSFACRHLWRASVWRGAHPTKGVARPREIAKLPVVATARPTGCWQPEEKKKIKWMLVLPSVEERAAEAVNSSQNPPPPPLPRSVWRKIHLFPVSQKTFVFFLNIWERRQKKIRFRFCCASFCTTTSNGCSVIVLYLLETRPEREHQIISVVVFCFVTTRRRNASSVFMRTPFILKIWQPEMFFFLFKATISYFLL